MIFNLQYDPNIYSVDINKDVIVVSDIHLGSNGSLGLNYIVRYGVERNIKYIVIAGDLFENRHFKHSYDDLLKLCRDILYKWGLNIFEKIFIVLSRYSHDPIIDDDRIYFKINGIDFLVKYGLLKLALNGTNIYITHGDIICPNGFIANLVNSFYEIFYGKKFFLERKLKENLNISDWLIMGHTHIAGIDYDLKIANTGSWKNYLNRSASKSLIHISSNEIKLCYLKNGWKYV